MSASTMDLLEKALRQRQSLHRRTNALRLVNGSGDGMEDLILEQYNQHFSAQIFDRRWLKEKSILMEFIKQLGGRYFIVKDRSESAASSPDGFQKIIWLNESGSAVVVKENNLIFNVELNDTLNTGLFLDMRRNRMLVAKLSSRKKVLNCFAYTCSFGVYSRAAGAVSVVNVDISAKSLATGHANYKLNRLVPARNELIRADVVDYLEKAVQKKNRFDVIILDPPSFSRNKGKTFSVKKDFPKLIKVALQILNPGGILFVATNFSGLSHAQLEGMIRAPGRPIKRIQRLGQDEDFPGTNTSPESYLAALLVKF